MINFSKPLTRIECSAGRTDSNAAVVCPRTTPEFVSNCTTLTQSIGRLGARREQHFTKILLGGTHEMAETNVHEMALISQESNKEKEFVFKL